jgi:predicted dehydrogenase
MTGNVLRIGVIGCGHWGPNHIRVFSQLRESQVAACADLDPKRINAIQEQYPGIQSFKDYRQMLADAAIDAVVISTPTGLHHPMVRDALNAGKHVLCEKPLCLLATEATDLVSLAASKSLILMTGHVFLFNTGIIKLKELLKFCEAGRIHYLRAQRTNLGPIREDVNCVFDLATHDISIFNFLLDAAPEAVSAVGGTFLQDNIEDVAFISLRYPGNVLAHIQVSWLDPKKLREIVVVGDKKMIIWDDLASAGPITIYDKGVAREPYYDDYGQFHLLSREGDITIPKVRLDEPLKLQNRYFLQCIGEGKIKMSDGPFSISVVRVLEAVSQSMKQGGATVAVPR